MTGALVICTKDRHTQLVNLLDYLAENVKPLPEQIVIVDSSAKALSRTELPNVARSKFKYVHSKPGLPHQRNVGVSALRDLESLDFVSFLDDDVYPCADYFERVDEIFSSTHGLVVLGGFDAFRRPNRQRAILRALGLQSEHVSNVSSGGFGEAPIPDSRLVDCLWVPGGMQNVSAWVFRFEKFRGSIRMYGEDMEMHLRLRKFGRICASNLLPVNHVGIKSGKDDLRQDFYFQAAFRLSLADAHPDLVRKSKVLISTTLYAFWLIVSSGTYSAKHQYFCGLFDFLIGFLRGKVKQQVVGHDDWQKYSKIE